MKNVINYYYNLFPDNIHQINKRFIFNIDSKYIFVPYDNELDRINNVQKISNLLTNKNIKHNEIIKNVTNSLVTYVNNSPYVLIKINIDDENIVILDDIIKFQNEVIGILNDKVNIKLLLNLWKQKVDYFEYQVSQFGIKFPIIRNSFNYFIGLAENAIILLNNIANSDIDVTICHYRMPINLKTKDLYNCLNFVIDSKVRDISEYVKELMFLSGKSLLIKYYLSFNYINNNELILLFSRLLYPTYYFDICEKIIDGGNDNYLYKILERISIYENNIKEIYYFIKEEYKIPEIEWLN